MRRRLAAWAVSSARRSFCGGGGLTELSGDPESVAAARRAAAAAARDGGTHLVWPLPAAALAALEDRTLAEAVAASAAAEEASRAEASGASASAVLDGDALEEARQRVVARAASLLPSAHKARFNKTALNLMKVKELREELELVGVTPSGRKADLVDQLLVALGGHVTKESRARRGQNVEKLTVQSIPPVESREGPPQVRRTDARARAAAALAARPFARVLDPAKLAGFLVEAHGLDVVSVNVAEQCEWTDHMVLATGRTLEHVSALAQAVLFRLKRMCPEEVAAGIPPQIEGSVGGDSKWLVVDAGNCVVHVFTQDARAEYDLESKWGGAANEHITRYEGTGAGAPLTLESIRVDDHEDAAAE